MQGRPIISLNKRSFGLALYSPGSNPTRMFCTDSGLLPRGMGQRWVENGSRMGQVRLKCLDGFVAFIQTSRVVWRWVVPIRASNEVIIWCEGALTVPFLHISASCGLANPQSDPCSVVLHGLAWSCSCLHPAIDCSGHASRPKGQSIIWDYLAISHMLCDTRSHSASHQRGDTSLITLKYLIRGSAQSGLVAMHPSTLPPLP